LKKVKAKDHYPPVVEGAHAQRDLPEGVYLESLSWRFFRDAKENALTLTIVRGEAQKGTVLRIKARMRPHRLKEVIRTAGSRRH